MMTILNSPKAWASARETIHTRDELRSRPTDFSVYHRTRLDHATDIDPVKPRPRVMNNASRPVLDEVVGAFLSPAYTPPTPKRSAERSFIPAHQPGATTWFGIYDAESGYRMFRVQGTYRHALREAARYTSFPTTVRPETE